MGDKVINAGVTRAESEVPNFRTLLQEKTREGVRSPAKESSCPKLQYCQPVSQEYRGVHQQRPKVSLGPGVQQAKGGVGWGGRSHSVLLSDDSHGQQPILLAEFFS